MLERYLGQYKNTPLGWDDLGHGAPTVIALARLAADGLAAEAAPIESEQLLPEAQTILYAAQHRGVISIRGNNQAFDSVDRFLSVFVETAPDQHVRFGSKESPRQTVRFLEGFAQICQNGLAMHHLYHEFSLTDRGFRLAGQVSQEAVAELMRYGVDPHRAEW